MREPSVLRVAPVPLYNSFSDVHHFIETLGSALAASEWREQWRFTLKISALTEVLNCSVGKQSCFYVYQRYLTNIGWKLKKVLLHQLVSRHGRLFFFICSTENQIKSDPIQTFYINLKIMFQILRTYNVIVILILIQNKMKTNLSKLIKFSKSLK